MLWGCGIIGGEGLKRGCKKSSRETTLLNSFFHEYHPSRSEDLSIDRSKSEPSIQTKNKPKEQECTVRVNCGIWNIFTDKKPMYVYAMHSN